MRFTLADYKAAIGERYSSTPDLDTLERMVNEGLKILRQPIIDTGSLVWLVGLFGILREVVPTIQNERKRKIDNLGTDPCRDPSNLRHQRGRSEMTEYMRDYIRGIDGGILERAAEVLKFSKRVERFFADCAVLYDQAKPLIKERIDQYFGTPTKHRLRGDNYRIAFLITWLKYGKFDNTLHHDALLGWRVTNASHIVAYAKRINKQFRIYRGAKRTKGEKSPSWALTCEHWRSVRTDLYDVFKPHIGYQPTRSDMLRSGITSGWRIGIYGPVCGSSNTNSTVIDHVAYRRYGIKQNTIARWLVSKGVNHTRIMPRVSVTGQPLAIDQPGPTGTPIKYYAIPCCWGHESETSLKRLNENRLSFIVFCDGMTDVYHIGSSEISGDIPDPLDMSKEDQAKRAIQLSVSAITARMARDRAEQARQKLLRLSSRQQLARLVKMLRTIPVMTRADSYGVGNCKPGTADFIQQLGLSDAESVDGLTMAKRWRSQQYCSRSYFERVILALGERQIVVAND